MIKKSLAFIFCLLFFLALVIAQENKISVKAIKDNFKAGENITLQVSLYDAENNPLDANVDLIIEDSEKKNRIEETALANKFVDISLGDKAPFGYWKIAAKYQSLEASALFFIEENELAKFELKEDILTAENIGNTRYSRTVQIVIGETIGTKELNLETGEKTSFRLLAPDGTYNIKITDGTTTLTKANVALTGNVVGILDERVTQTSPLTGGIRPGKEDEDIIGGIKNRSFVYVFVIVMIVAGILLLIERTYRRKLRE